MAIPPTGFTRLLYQEKTPAGMYERLKSERCLSADGLHNGAEVIALISGILRAWEEKEGRDEPFICGGGPVDEVANALLMGNYTSDRGHRLHRTHLYQTEAKRQWWKFWG